MGKSTLFNRLIGHRTAIEHETAHTTRDVVYGVAPVIEGAVQIGDTAGDELALADEINQSAKTQREQAVRAADAIIFVFDGIEGLTADDQRVLRAVRKLGRPFIVVATKCDNPQIAAAAEKEALTVHNQVATVSAIHKGGLMDLLGWLQPYAKPYRAPHCTNVVLVGRQNAGKSTLFNTLVKRQASIVSTIPGTTRDIVTYEMTMGDEPVRLFDTAGLMKRSRAMQGLDRFATLRLEETLVMADVAVLCIDGEHKVAAQDAKIAQKALEAGTAVILAVTKWDLIQNQSTAQEEWQQALLERFHFAPWLPVVFISSINPQNLSSLTKQIALAAQNHHFRAPQEQLDSFLTELKAKNSRFRVVRRVEQSETDPPTFTVKIDGAWNVYDKRQLTNSLRRQFDLGATPITVREDLARGRKRGLRRTGKGGRRTDPVSRRV